MQWVMKTVRTPIYSLGWAYNNISKLGHDDLFNSLAVKARNRSHCLILVSLGIAHLYGPKQYSTARGDIFPCQPLLLRVWLENSMQSLAWRLNSYT